MNFEQLLKDLHESDDIKIDDEGMGKFTPKAKAALFDALQIDDTVENTIEWIDLCAEISAEAKELHDSLMETSLREDAKNNYESHMGTL